jgi:hypothetical protein
VRLRGTTHITWNEIDPRVVPARLYLTISLTLVQNEVVARCRVIVPVSVKVTDDLTAGKPLGLKLPQNRFFIQHMRLTYYQSLRVLYRCVPRLEPLVLTYLFRVVANDRILVKDLNDEILCIARHERWNLKRAFQDLFV